MVAHTLYSPRFIDAIQRMMALKLYNSLTREKQKFIPKNPGEVRMYVCGMTVYGYCHIGHARMLVVFDIIVRWLRALGYKTTYVRNITDVDDKIIRQAALNHESVEELTVRFIHAMQEDCKVLGLLAPDFEPKATEHIAQMIDMIKVLEDRGLAYLSGDGDVCFSVRKFPNYGQLSRKSLDQLRAGERVKVAHGKDDPLDFVLWKKAKPGEPQWPSPWGPGRPGWHIECSAMAEAFLGSNFDIHGGGLDLQFPHHENEIAQSDGAAGHVCVNYWLHNGFVRIDEAKMSKSTGNFITIRDALATHHPEVLRYLILRTHYRSPLNYSQSNLEDARHALDRLYTALLPHVKLPTSVNWQSQEGQKFRLAMNDDFNTPDALTILHELASQANLGNREAASQLFSLGRVLMLFSEPPRNYFQNGHALGKEEIEKRLAARLAARKSKKFAEADRIRDDLLAQGIELEDTPDGTRWRKI